MGIRKSQVFLTWNYSVHVRTLSHLSGAWMAASEPFLGDVFPEMNSHAILANKRSLLRIPWSPRRHSIPDPRSSSVMSPLSLILLSDFVVRGIGTCRACHTIRTPHCTYAMHLLRVWLRIHSLNTTSWLQVVITPGSIVQDLLTSSCKTATPAVHVSRSTALSSLHSTVWPHWPFAWEHWS
jgi:hypothetical protein